jgi:uncharacterized membrane protein
VTGSDPELPDEFYADFDRRARARRERRTARRRSDRDASSLGGSRAGRILIGAVAALALLTVIGLVALWPHHEHHGRSEALGGPTTAATVAATRDIRCPGPTPQRCRQLIVSVHGERAPITLGPVGSTTSVSDGDKVRVARVQAPPGARLPAGFEHWSFVDLDRRGSLLWLGLALAALALVVIRVRGVLAAVGVGLSLLVVTTFVVPAILQGRPALLVALVGALAVMFVTLVLTNGFGAQTLAAALGIGSTLLMTCLLGVLAVHAVHLDGYSSELATFLSQQNHKLSLRGVVLAGMVIGALGVLTDTAVTQASAVMALRRANPELSGRTLYRRAFVVGRDHLSATIHTLVLAYTGTALPLLLVMHSSGVNVTDALNSQDIAEPVTATVVGCLGLVAAVPITTGLAAYLVSRVPPRALGDGHADHHL